MAVPKSEEVCKLVIDGKTFQTWETVMVQHRYLEPYPIFEVTVSEPTPSPTSFAAIRFNIGDVVQVYLAGILAVSGVICTRQSAADSERHGIQFVGKGKSWQMAKSSVPFGEWNFDNQTYLQVATTICGAFGVGVKVIGEINSEPFKKLQAKPGEAAWDFLEINAREKEIILGSDEFGDLLLIGDNDPEIAVDVLREGGSTRNIERISVIFSNDTLFKDYIAVGQSDGTDQLWGTDAAQIAAFLPGADPNASHLVVPTEEPGDSASVQRRARFEARTHDATELTATVTVPGWLRSDGDIWRVGLTYNVIAPDHFPGFDQGIQLAAKTVTFEQTEVTGTTATLELVFPWLLGGTLLQPGVQGGPTISETQSLP